MTTHDVGQRTTEAHVANLLTRALPVPVDASTTASMNSLYLLCSMTSSITEKISRCTGVLKVLKCLGGEQTLAATYIQVG
jgi:hypothetical protein